jgi:hypothetical protein
VQRAAVSEIFVHQAGGVPAAVVPDVEGRDYNDPALVTLP